jgi:DNA-binding response OmpR family regulator
VLIVEDDEIVSQSMRLLLTNAGLCVLVAASGRDALEHCDETNPVLVVMDVGLWGDVDGLEVGATVSALGAYVLYVTARSDIDTLRRAAGTNVVGFVVKPFSDRQLMAAVSLAIDRVHTADAASRSRCAALDNAHEEFVRSRAI